MLQKIHCFSFDFNYPKEYLFPGFLKAFQPAIANQFLEMGIS